MDKVFDLDQYLKDRLKFIKLLKKYKWSHLDYLEFFDYCNRLQITGEQRKSYLKKYRKK